MRLAGQNVCSKINNLKLLVDLSCIFCRPKFGFNYPGLRKTCQGVLTKGSRGVKGTYLKICLSS